MILSLTNCLDAITTTPVGTAAATVNTTTTSTATINYYRPISFEHKISHVSFYSIFYNRPGILYILDLRQILKLFNLTYTRGEATTPLWVAIICVAC